MILRLAYFLFFSSVSKLQISYSIVIATKCICIKSYSFEVVKRLIKIVSGVHSEQYLVKTRFALQ